MFPLVETIRVQDGVLANLELHRIRMKTSYKILFETVCPFDLKNLLVIPQDFSKGLVKLRFLYSKDDFEIQFSHYQPKEINSIRLVFNDIIDYSLKYTDRNLINLLLQEKGKADDILIVKNALITDTSIANILFFDGENWITPSSPLLKGICRSFLLRNNEIIERDIHWKEIPSFESFSLINALNCKYQEQILPISSLLGI